MNLTMAVLQIMAINVSAFSCGAMTITDAYKKYRLMFALNVLSCGLNTILLFTNITNI